MRQSNPSVCPYTFSSFRNACRKQSGLSNSRRPQTRVRDERLGLFLTYACERTGLVHFINVYQYAAAKLHVLKTRPCRDQPPGCLKAVASAP